MVENFPGPYEIEFTITGNVSPPRDHLFRGSCNVVGTPAPGALPTAVTMQKQGGGTATLSVVANQIWEFIRLFYGNTISCSGFQLWKYVAGTLAKDFISAGAVTNPACTGTGGTASGQLTQTYRSANGGIMKLVLLETNQTGNARITLIPNGAGTPSQRLAAYVMSADNVFLARDNGYIVSALRDSRGENESLWRLINR